MNRLLLIFIIIAGIKFVLNFYYWIECKWLYKKYNKYLTEQTPKYAKYRTRIKESFKRINENSPHVPLLQDIPEYKSYSTRL